MKRILLILIFWVSVPQVFSQTNASKLVMLSGSGETTYAPSGGFSYSHHTNYSMNIRSITVKWDLRLLLGEPVVDGVFQWTAGDNTPVDYLDYRDCVLLECSPQKSFGYLVYIKIAPTVPKSGEGYGFNTPGSPAWSKVFCTRTGEDMTTRVPGFNAKTAKEIWKNGFYVTGVVLVRQGGNDGYLQSDNGAQQEEAKKLQALQQDSFDKYEALKNPFSLSVKNNDTVYTNKIKPIKYIHPYFSNGIFAMIIRNDEFSQSSRSPDAEVNLSPGWNVLSYLIRKTGASFLDSLRIFYSEKGDGSLLKDDFNDGVLDSRWIVEGETGDWVTAREESGILLIRQGGERTGIRINSNKLAVNPNQKLIIEVTSRRSVNIDYYPADILINRNYSLRCRKYCEGPEHARIICDLKNGTAECSVNGEIIRTYERIHFKPEEGIEIGFYCAYWQQWEIDDISVYQ